MGALQKEKKMTFTLIKYAVKPGVLPHNILEEALSMWPFCLILQFMPHVFPSHCHISFHFIYEREYSSVLAPCFP